MKRSIFIVFSILFLVLLLAAGTFSAQPLKVEKQIKPLTPPVVPPVTPRPLPPDVPVKKLDGRPRCDQRQYNAVNPQAGDGHDSNRGHREKFGQ